MSINIWAFKDASGAVRVTGNDPVAAMGARSVVVMTIPGGFSMRDMRRHFDSTTATMSGGTGDEAYVKLILEDLSAEVLTALMTVPE